MSVPQPNITRLPTSAALRVPGNVAPAASRSAVGARLAAWLALVCKMIPAVTAAEVNYGAGRDGAYDSCAIWPPGADADAEIAAFTAQLQRSGEPQGMAQMPGASSVLLARRLSHGSHADTLLVLKLAPPAAGQQETLFKLIDWSAAWLALVLAGEHGHAHTTRLELLSAALAAPDLREAATTMAIRIATLAGADSASIGLLRGERVELLARSHTASFDPATGGNRALTAAMEEALDEDHVVAAPSLTSDACVASFAHAQLCSHESALAVCTLPLRDGTMTLGALTLCRHRGAVFTAVEVTALTDITSDIARVLRTRRDAEASPGTRLVVALAAFGGAHRRGVRFAGAVVLLMMLALSCVSGTYRVAAPATLRGSIQRSIVAPIDGYVLEAPARAGDVVKQGDVLAVLDTQRLEFERRKWLAEQAEADKTLRQAVAKLDRVAAAISKAQLGKASAQLALVETQIERARLTAPFAGMVIAGDLSRAMGAPVTRGEVLFEIAPLDDYRVELEVDERDVADIRPGQHGALALTSWSAAPLPFTVDKVLGVAHTSDGHNVFKVDAVLSAELSQLRPGMQGVGRIETGPRRLWWVWTHALFDRVRLWLWWRVP